MDRYRPAMGTPIRDLDTPCLLVDLAALESNYRTVARAYDDPSVKMRQHSKNIKTPLLAHLQMRMGGSIGGVCTAKVAEAEVMVEGRHPGRAGHEPGPPGQARPPLWTGPPGGRSRIS